jgi:integrase
MATLKWQQVNFKEKMIMIRTRDDFVAKTISSERDIPISDYLYKVLIHIPENKRNEYVFPSTKGDKLSERTLLTVCKKIAEACEIDKSATLHKFRHTWSSLLSQLGIAYEVREFLLGHKPHGSLTGHYTKLDAKKYHAVVSLLDKYLED